MRINPTLLLLMLVIFVFAPSIQEWVTQGGTAWYRPYQLWLSTIIFVWWSVKRIERKQNQARKETENNN
ncbi:hypothetical protein [Oceanicoccus sp. KOV_DT_Chl]|uniref:hypothetical protein n=1 Tax=Oceanicoccus sp. KOV_DT_Chl TaxID=1904639 RepID=UPI000C7976D7|nr:hypothetical protein [Oceanicoccus sp. KOV_DT_Chl]